MLKVARKIDGSAALLHTSLRFASPPFPGAVLRSLLSRPPSAMHLPAPLPPTTSSSPPPRALVALAAHHGLPTRLLDWTYSPFVALHFATRDLRHYEHDGVVWCVNHRESNILLPESLRKALEAQGSDVFSVEMLNSEAATLEALQQLSPEPFVVFLEPPSLDSRIVNQFALFSLVSTPYRTLQEWLAAHSGLCHRIVIPAELKWEIRDKLDQAGITERVLFPGLDGLTAWLTRYYTPRNVPVTDLPDEGDLTGATEVSRGQ